MPHLSRFDLLVKQTWKESRPRMYAELDATGQLEAALYAAQERAKDILAEMVSQEARYEEAWEVAKDELFLPSEADQPRLGENVSSHR